VNAEDSERVGRKNLVEIVRDRERYRQTTGSAFWPANCSWASAAMSEGRPENDIGPPE
jgi:hypothetical protein